MLDPIYQAVVHHIDKRPSLLVAFSGGIDSTVLLHALYRLREAEPNLALRAIYIHHGLSSNADSWAKQCQAICEQWQIPFILEQVQIDKTEGNIEEQARDARYQAIFQHLQVGETLCIAQHLDDQCETFLLALKRGSGPAGLSAMPTHLELKREEGDRSISILRPLLAIPRKEIEAYAQHHHLQWIEDESNQDDRYDRNFLRLNILPLLQSRWPHFAQMVTRSAALCGEQEALIAELLSTDLAQMMGEEGQLSIALLSVCSEYKRNAILRMWLKSQGAIMPSQKQLSLIWQTVVLAKHDANPQFVLANHQIRRYQNRLYLLPKYVETENIVIEWDCLSPIVLPDNIGLLQCKRMLTADSSNCDNKRLYCRQPHDDEEVTIRFHTMGRKQVAGREGSRPMKKLWQAYNVPSWQRTRIPLIFYNEQLIAVVGQFVTEQGAGSDCYFTLTIS